MPLASKSVFSTFGVEMLQPALRWKLEVNKSYISSLVLRH